MTAIVKTKGVTRFMQEGPDYYEVLPQIAERMNCQTYFEVGVNTGRSLMGIKAASIGVDPLFRLKVEVMGTKPMLQLYQMTSDDFFARHSPKDLFGKPVDLAFLDGMHLFEFLLRDFINTETQMHENSVILLHDCLPINAEMTERQRNGLARKDVEYRGYWTGDVWKMIPVLKKYRPDLSVSCLDCTPTGLAVIRNLDPKSTVLKDNYQKIIDEFIPVVMTDPDLEAYVDTHRSTRSAVFLDLLGEAA